MAKFSTDRRTLLGDGPCCPLECFADQLFVGTPIALRKRVVTVELVSMKVSIAQA
jgi:hypothetical protein